MSVTPNFRDFVLEQLGRVVDSVRSRAMFGGVGIYSHDHFFALISKDVVYFKVDDETRPDYVARGMGPFQPGGPSTPAMHGYYELPSELLEDVDELRPWVERSLTLAKRKGRAAR